MGVYRIAFSGVLGAGQLSYVTGITDLELLPGPGDPLLVTTTRAGGGMGVFNATTGALLRTLPLSADLTQLTAPALSLIQKAGQTYLTTLGLRDAGVHSVNMLSNGELGAAGRLTAPGQDLGLITGVSAAGYGNSSYHYASIRGTGLLRLETSGATQFTAQSVALSGSGANHMVSDLVTVTLGGRDYLVASFATADSIAVFRVTTGGNLLPVSEHGASQGLGIDAPTVLRPVQIGETAFVIVASTLSSSLSVFATGINGVLVPVDHVIDDLHTRFSRVTALETITVDNRHFVMAGGGDDGVSLFVMLPNGRLVHLDSIADSLQSTLANVSTLAATRIGQSLHIFATSEREPGITRLTVDIGSIGQSQQAGEAASALTGGAQDDILIGGAGNDTLNGGAGNDIIFDGPGRDIMTGGPGADLFVLAADGERDVITDFQPGLDRLDLSAWVGLTSPSQLQITSQSWGAEIRFQSEELELRSANGGSLSRAEVLWAPVLNLTRLPVGTLTAPPTGTPDTPAPPPTPGQPLNLTGGAGDDLLIGGTGNDTLNGAGGDDRLFGGDGDDLLTGSNGNDTLYGGAGNDRLLGNNGDDLLVGDAGDDQLWGGDGHDTLYGGAGSDTLHGGNGNDLLFGGDGDDLLVGGAGADTMDGGEGSDIYEVDPTDTVTDTGTTGFDIARITNPTGVLLSLAGWSGLEQIEGAAGSDTIDASTQREGINILGHGGDDVLIGGAGNDRLFGGVGRDRLIGGAGDDTLYGGAGNDTLIGGPGADYMDGGDGSDLYMVDALDTVIDTGTYGYDRAQIYERTGVALNLNTWRGVQRVDGLTGNDTLDASLTTDAIFLFGHHGDDVLMGGDGRDTLNGGAGNDMLFGGGGNDRLVGNTGDDTLYGGDGNDTLIGWLGADFMDGGNGSDYYMVDALDTVIDTGTYGYDRAQVYERTGIALNLNAWRGVERVNGFTGNDTLDASLTNDAIFLFGHAGDDILMGGAGRDTLVGGAGNDVLYGGAGNDVMMGSAGNDTLYGGDGNDVLNGGSGNDVLFGGAGNDRLVGSTGDDTLYGGDGNDTLIGWLGADYMDGGNGSDLYMVDARDTVVDTGTYGYDRAQIYETTGVALNLTNWRGVERVNGFTGNDTLDASLTTDAIFLFGHAGNDLLYGGSGNDTLVGGAGNDTLVGGPGDDWLVGGPGADMFVFRPGFGRDIIADFQKGLDVINLAGHAGLHGFADLQIRQFGANTLIRTTENSPDLLILANFESHRLTAEDFIF